MYNKIKPLVSNLLKCIYSFRLFLYKRYFLHKIFLARFLLELKLKNKLG